MGRRLLLIALLLVVLLAFSGYAGKDSQLMRNWHPMFIAPALDSLGFPGHENIRHYHPVANGAFTDGAPVTSCWHYDFLERDCDGPDHYKALVSGTRVGAYKGDPNPIVYPLPLRAKACAITADSREVCVSDWRDDGRVVWRETHGRIVRHALVIACPGPHFELPCRSKDP